MNKFTRDSFKKFSCKMIIDGAEYDCIPPDRGGRAEFLLMLDLKQQDDLREKISTMDRISVSCESVGISNGFVSDVKFHINNNLVITMVSVLNIS